MPSGLRIATRVNALFAHRARRASYGLPVSGSLSSAEAEGGSERTSVVGVLLVATRLGLTSFGGPVAHLGYFRREYVERRQWVDEATFADLVALSQVLPGPASSQLGIAIGTLRAGFGLS